MIFNLPNEILAQLFRNLPPWDLHNVSIVNTHWCRITKTLGVCRLDFSCLSDKQFINDTKVMIDLITKVIPTAGDGALVRHILIVSPHHYLLPNNVFLFIQHLCPHVISFDYDRNLFDNKTTTIINDNSDDQLLLSQRHSFFSSSSHWRHSIAHLPACHHEDQLKWWEMEEICHRLESLYVRAGDFLLSSYERFYRSIGLIVPHLPRLHVLTLHIPSLAFDEYTLDKIHKQCPRLISLTLREISLGNLHPVFVPLRVESKLKHLTLNNVTFLDLDLYKHLPHKYPNLQSLTIIFSTKTTTTHNHRRSLSVSGTNEHIYTMIVGFKHLTKLVVYLEGFGSHNKEDPIDHWFQHKMQDYLSVHANKHIDCQVTYGPVHQNPKRLITVRKILRSLFV